jgi:hypothetical protein
MSKQQIFELDGVITEQEFLDERAREAELRAEHPEYAAKAASVGEQAVSQTVELSTSVSEVADGDSASTPHKQLVFDDARSPAQIIKDIKDKYGLTINKNPVDYGTLSITETYIRGRQGIGRKK